MIVLVRVAHVEGDLHFGKERDRRGRTRGGRRRCRTSGDRCPAPSGPSVSVVTRPLPSVVPRPIGVHSLAWRSSRMTVMPFRRLAARDVEHVCRDHGSCPAPVEQLRQPQARNLPLLVRRDAQSRSSGSLPQPALEQVQHLGGRLAGRADDENVSESRFVVAVRVGEPSGAWRRRRPATPACSCADQPQSPTRLRPPAPPAPIFGCAANASSQSARSSAVQTLSAASAIASALANGRAAAICRAQRDEPQHRSSSRAARRHRARSDLRAHASR